MNYKLIVPAISFLLSLSGCISYTISVASLKSQFSEVDNNSLTAVGVRGPGGVSVEYLTNPIEIIKCIDKNGNAFELQNSPSIETRITTSDGNRTVFYFDRMYVENDSLIGYRSRFIGAPKNISLNDIVKIEVQDGHKNFHYIENKK